MARRTPLVEIDRSCGWMCLEADRRANLRRRVLADMVVISSGKREDED